MTLSQSVVSELLDAFPAGGVDLIRDAVQFVLQELIETEASEQIGAARYERADTRVTEGSGARPRLVTRLGDVQTLPARDASAGADDAPVPGGQVR